MAIARASTGQVVARFAYVAWGKCTVTSASGYAVGTMNPFRYRGYYFDQESGLYYLNSRYYSPEFGRFISPDVITAMAIAPESLNYGKNLFAYCDNNPICRKDEEGEFWHLVVGAVVGAAISTFASVASQKRSTGSVDLVTTMIAAGTGAIGGALTASGVPVGGQIIAGASLGFVGDYLTQKREIALGVDGKTEVDKTELFASTAIGGLCGLISGPGASASKGGQKHMINLGVNTVKRTWNALSNKGIGAFFTESGKAAKYYVSNTRTITSNLFKSRNLVAQLLGNVGNISAIIR